MHRRDPSLHSCHITCPRLRALKSLLMAREKEVCFDTSYHIRSKFPTTLAPPRVWRGQLAGILTVFQINGTLLWVYFLGQHLPSSEKPKLWFSLCILLSLLVFYQTALSWLSFLLFTALIISFTYFSIVYYFLTFNKLLKQKIKIQLLQYIQNKFLHILLFQDLFYLAFSLWIRSEANNFC